MLSADRLRAVLSYDPGTGLFHWLQRTSNRIKVGDLAGQLLKTGYHVINVDGVRYGAHTLAIFYTTGQFPTDVVDHWNGRPGDNRLKNLRCATPLLNAQNRRLPSKNNQCGLLGVAKCPSTGRWRSQILANGKKHHLGRFDTAEEAHKAYVIAKRKLHEGNTL